MKDLYKLKGKSIESNVQPSQDNREDMVKKFEKGSTVTLLKVPQRRPQVQQVSSTKEEASG